MIVLPSFFLLLSISCTFIFSVAFETKEINDQTRLLIIEHNLLKQKKRKIEIKIKLATLTICQAKPPYCVHLAWDILFCD